jgi:hypothetical protein
MATKSSLKSLFKGKDNPAEEKKEAKAVRSGKITPAQYMKGERMEGDKPSKKTAMALKSGKMSPAKYAAQAKK